VVYYFSQARHIGLVRNLLGIVVLIVIKVVFIRIVLIVLVTSGIARVIFVIVRIVVFKISCKLHT